MGARDQPILRPLLRGWLHAICFFVSLPAAFLLFRSASSAAGRWGSVAYGVGLATLFGVSGSYHRGRWSPPARLRMKRLDHAAIFVMIASTYTPLGLLALDGWPRVVMLAVAWTGAVAGVALALGGVAERRVIGIVCYIAFGWIAIGAVPHLARTLTGTDLVLIVAGGVFFTAGAIVLGTKWPDPFPRVFGYHEVWHVVVVVAVTLHYLAISSVTRRLG